MAYRIYISNFEVQESNIDGFDSIKVKKDLSDTYWGYWNEDGFGFGTEGSTKVTIKDQLVSSYVKKVFDRDGFSAEIPVIIINEDSGQRVELLIDFSDYSEMDCCYIQCSFRPKGGGDLLRSREKVEYPLQLTETIRVPIRDLPSQVNFSVTNSIYSGGTGDSLSHYIPLTVGENAFDSGTPNNVVIGEEKQFVTFNTDDCISIVGSVKVSGSSNTSGLFYAYLKIGATTYLIGSYPINSTLTEQTITIEYDTDVTVTDQASLYITSSIASSLFQFAYDASSAGISIQRCESTPIEWKEVKAISVKNAFKTIIGNSTNQISSLSKYIFDDCLFDGYLTNNDGLQGFVSTINVSLIKLFDELNNKYPSSIDISGLNVNVLARCEFIKCGTPYEIFPTDINRDVNSALLYSNVKVGYNNWKSESKFGSLEYNSTREYATDYAISSNSLSLLNDWSSSSSIISEQIRKKKEKEEIHWIVVNKETNDAETDEYISTDVFDSDKAINLRIAPTRNLSRWRKFILSNLKFIGGSGNYNLYTDNEYECNCQEEAGIIDESQDINSESILGKFVYNIELDSCSVDISRLKGCVSFLYCEEKKVGIVKSVEYSISQTSAETIIIKVIELANV